MNLRPTKGHLTFKLLRKFMLWLIFFLSQVICFSFLGGYGNVCKQEPIICPDANEVETKEK